MVKNPSTHLSLSIMPPMIDTANALSISDFLKKFLPDLPTALPFHSPSMSTTNYNLNLESSSTITKADLLSCFELIKATSYDDYKASSIGWSRRRKMKEMRLPDLRYLLIKKGGLAEADSTIKYASDLMGFLSFMLTYEDGYEAVYCYEIHIQSELRGSGAGKSLMGIMEMVGRRAEVAKAMLTVFVENKGAMKFYEKLGYEKDEFSPAPRRLRNGVIKNPTYLILSKSLL